jgi:hypothetical protein
MKVRAFGPSKDADSEANNGEATPLRYYLVVDVLAMIDHYKRKLNRHIVIFGATKCFQTW